MAETTGTTQIGLQFSLYPLRQHHLRPAIAAALEEARKEGVVLSVGKLSTFGTGDKDAVFAALRAAFDAACAVGPTVMVVTLSSGLPDDDAVAILQDAAQP